MFVNDISAIAGSMRRVDAAIWRGYKSYDSRINEDIQDSEDGFCQPYRGYACSKHINNKNIFVKNKLQQSQVEESVTSKFWKF